MNTSAHGSRPPNKQLERTVIRHHERTACASFHCAHAARWTRGPAADQLRRLTARQQIHYIELSGTSTDAGSRFQRSA